MRLSIGLLAVICPPLCFGQAKPPPQIFGVCGSPGNLPTVYFSGVLQGPAASFQGFRSGFLAFLQQRYAYKGIVGCLPAKDAATAQNFINVMAAKIRNGKRTALETGWSESPAVAAMPALGAATAKAQAIVPAAAAAPSPTQAASGASGTGSTAAGSSAGGSNQLTSILGAIFGTGSGTAAGAGTGGGQSSGSKSSAGGGAAASGASGAGPGASAAGQGSLNQVSSALSNVFNGKSSGAGASAAPKQGLPDGALGSAKSQTTQLIVFGCGRQDAQVACVNQVINQNQKDTLVLAADVWKDTFIVDDRGDRHQRSKGFFLNIDGDQRDQLDVGYGKSARFILMFDNVPTKVQKVTLRSAAGELDVEDIALVAPGGSAH